MKPFIIRKTKCGHWGVWKCEEISNDLLVFRDVAHCETFGDILYLINVGVRVNG